ncbi:hypothetical protein ACH4NF_14670 [Streptomyces sp. NPDC017248]|uniref:hypothetical protein n=1 Tax=unclassified Streptomyces TaxID=2593676 RepID=UPI003791524E
MEDWSVLDLARDPVPGDPARIQTLAARLLREAEYAEQHASRLRQVAANSADLRMQGDYAPLFQQRLARLPQQAAGLGPAHESCGRALVAYMQTLEQAKIQSRAALSRGMQADAQYKAALQQFCTLVPGFSYTGNWRELDESFALRCTQYQRPEVRAAAARIGAYAAQAERERQAAATMARQAARAAAEAEMRCAQAIRAAIPALGSTAEPSSRERVTLEEAPAKGLLAGRRTLSGSDAADGAAGQRFLPYSGSGDTIDAPQSERAADLYELIRQTEGDTARIAENTGIDRGVLDRIKQHIFFTVHEDVPVGPGVLKSGRFAPMDHIADMWKMAEAGPLDEATLERFRRWAAHEGVESQLMADGVPYRSLDPAAWEDGVYWPSADHIGAHDLAPIENRLAPPFKLWGKLGIEPPSGGLADDLSNLDEIIAVARSRYP